MSFFYVYLSRRKTYIATARRKLPKKVLSYLEREARRLCGKQVSMRVRIWVG